MKFHNVSKKFKLLQPLDGSDVIPFPGGSTLDLTEKQAAANCRDLCAFLNNESVRAGEAAMAFVVEALAEFRAKAEAAKVKAEADRAALRSFAAGG